MFAKWGQALACLSGGSRRWTVAGAAVLLAGLAVPAVYGVAAAATVHTGTLSVSPKQVTAGDTADSIAFTWDSTNKAGAGTISIGIPAGFSAPQDANSGGAGYLQTTSACAQFQITGITPGPGGSSVVSIAENCAPGLIGVLLYSAAAVPTAAGSYPFAASFTPAGASSATLFAAKSVTVKPGPLASLTLSPATATITPGGTQSYTVTGDDAYGNPRGTIANAKFAIQPDGSCTGATCTASTLGTHTVTAKSGKSSGTATLTVSAPAQADLAVTESVSASTPYYYSPVSFTTTVTNTSTTTQSDGVTVAVAVPAGLITPRGTVSAGSYAAGTWAVGSLAPGASATLVLSGYAGDVSLGTQTVTATVSATTTDPNSANNTASASEASQPARLGATIVPFPTNPSNVDVSLPGDEGWTASAYNVENPSAPAPNLGGSPAGDWDASWFCSTASGNPCPDAAGTDDYNQLTLEYPISSLAPDTYTITLQVCPNTSNYVAQACAITAVTFTVSDSGAG